MFDQDFSIPKRTTEKILFKIVHKSHITTRMMPDHPYVISYHRI